MMRRTSLLFLRSVSKNLCFEISSSTVTGTKNYKTVSRRKNSVKKPFTNASRGTFRVQRTLVFP